MSRPLLLFRATIGAALVTFLPCGPAAAETSKSFVVSADIVTGCLVATNAAGNWGKIDFGSVSGVQSGTVDADLLSGSLSGLQISCTPGTVLSATADTGNQPSGGVRQLGLAGNASARIAYQLYANGGTTPWTTQAIAVAFPIGTQTVALPVKGRATLAGSQRAGNYSDTVRITLSW
jgi:spore coat protein U-like protein